MPRRLVVEHVRVERVALEHAAGHGFEPGGIVPPRLIEPWAAKDEEGEKRDEAE